MKTLMQILIVTWPLFFFGWAFLSLYLDYRKIPKNLITFKVYLTVTEKARTGLLIILTIIYLTFIFGILMWYVFEFIKTNFL